MLYLSIGEPQEGYGEENPEGHILRFDDDANFVGITLVDVKELLDENEAPCITLPQRTALRRDELVPVLA